MRFKRYGFPKREPALFRDQQDTDLIQSLGLPMERVLGSSGMCRRGCCL